ncbi:hypothetical protein LG302_12565 [Halomonas organivorans]
MEWTEKPSGTMCYQKKTSHRWAETLRQWEADRRGWRTKQPASALLAEGLPIEQAPAEVATATTDGVRLLVNSDWSAGLDDTTRRFVHAHLVWHCAAGHFRPALGHDTYRWHLACDHEVNVALLMMGFTLSPQAVLFPACIGKPTTAVYAWLADNPLIHDERSLDAPPWLTFVDSPGPVNATLSSFQIRYRHWQSCTIEVIRRYLGTPHLPQGVAAWLLNCW